MMHKEILLVEDNADDVELTRIAFEEAKVANRLVVARDGAEALDYLFARGEHAGRAPHDLPSIVLLDLNLPKVDGREVLQAIRADPRTRTLPVVVLTTSTTTGSVRVVSLARIACSTSRPSTLGRLRSSSTIDGRSWASRPA